MILESALLLALGMPEVATASVSTSSIAAPAATAGGRAARAPLSTEAQARGPAPRRPPVPAAQPTRTFRAALSLTGHLAGVPLAPGATAQWRGRSVVGVGGELRVGFSRVELATAVWGGRRSVKRRATPGGAVGDDNPVLLGLRASGRVDLDGPADGLGLHLGAGVGFTLDEGEAERRLQDPRCVDCPSVRDWRVQDRLTTLAFVPSVLWRAPIMEDDWRFAFDVEASLWLGHRDHDHIFSGEATSSASAAYDSARAENMSGLYVNLFFKLGVSFGYARDVGVRAAPGGRTRGYRPPPPPPPTSAPPPTPRRW